MAVSQRSRKGRVPRGKTALETYRVVRKPVAPPARVERDRRRAIDRRHAREEITEGLTKRKSRP